MKKMKCYALSLMGAGMLFSSASFAQTNVFDNVIAPSPNHTYLEAALIQEGLVGALQNPNATLTVFAPDDQAFTNLATALGTNIAGLLALPNLDDILLYHVLGTTVPSAAVTNGAIVQPLSPINTLKITATGAGNVYINQAQVTAVDLTTANGVVHVTNGVLLPVETVADIAIDNGFTTLVTAVVTAELLPALTNPLSNLTVFAPTNDAFQDIADEIGVPVAALLGLPELSAILTYHVLGIEVPSSSVTNGAIVQPLFPGNTLKMTVTGAGDVFVNQAQVTAVDIMADNGVVHVLDAVVLPIETVADVAIDNGFSTLVTAVVTAELLPALSDPFSEFTVFAPTNQAFTDLATALNTDLNGILALPNLADILLYHVVGGTVLSTQLTAGPVTTLEGSDVIVSLTGGVKINDANVTMADVPADNGVVHVLDKVILESYLGINENNTFSFGLFPNPSNGLVSINGVDNAEVIVSDLSGKTFISQSVNNNTSLDLNGLSNGTYLVTISQNGNQSVQTLVKF
ncbi:MAG: fasciclin domain-containing protein [Bacteroidetes bacterium]|nr:fasciclin domain-containing protein [Bacteroidota bacterium]MBM3424868.1 T9SS type A sorting domain-containing protein [Bacteroidota bacterium]